MRLFNLKKGFHALGADVSRGITGRKQAEDRLRESEAESRSTFEQSAAGMPQLSAYTGRFIRVNAKYCELTGYSADELAELMLADLTLVEDRESAQKAHEQMLGGGVEIYDREQR